ncbi:MAG: hypothetical protein JZU53_03295 [Paludibacter sp.]|nr:hypothetical protein [Paludibacter sp.]
MYKNKVLVLVLSSLVSLQFVVAQNNINSPYTRYGYGDISETNSGEQRALGGVAIGSRSHSYINTVNPASYSAVDSMTFMFDIGTSALSSRFSDANKSVRTFNANLEYLTMQFPLSKGMGFSAGLLPYSFAGYNMYNVDQIKGPEGDTISTSKGFTGTGGFSQVYMGLSQKIGKHISLGANVYYMYGSVNNTRSLRIGSLADSTIQTNSIKASNFRLRYGVQFYNTFDKKHDVTLGLIYEHTAKLNGDFSQITAGVLNDTTINNYQFELPTVFGIGLNYTYDNRISIGIDYSLQKWASTKYFWNPTTATNTESLNDRSKLSVGIEYTPKPLGRKFSDRIHYRLGSNISNAYYNVPGVTLPKNYGLSFGIGLPIYGKFTQTISTLNASIEYGKVGSSANLREDYFKFTMNLVFNEHWFFKRKL